MERDKNPHLKRGLTLRSRFKFNLEVGGFITLGVPAQALK